MNAAQFKENKLLQNLFGVDLNRNQPSVHEKIEAEKKEWQIRKGLNAQLLSQYDRKDLVLDRHTGLYSHYDAIMGKGESGIRRA